MSEFRGVAQLYAPYDERPHVGLGAADPATLAAGDAATVYVITHADIISPEQFTPCDHQVDPSGPCGNEMMSDLATFGSTHEGNMRFDILTQSNCGNHMSVVEMWATADAQVAHQNTVEKSIPQSAFGYSCGRWYEPRPAVRAEHADR